MLPFFLLLSSCFAFFTFKFRFTLHFPLPPCFLPFLFFLPLGIECQADNIISNPVVPDGYGLSYSIGDDYIRWTITSLKRDTSLLKALLGRGGERGESHVEGCGKGRGEGRGGEGGEVVGRGTLVMYIS